MKQILFTLALVIGGLAFGQAQGAERDTTNANPNYDAALAEKLGADEYGMKMYFLVMLTTGENPPTDQALIGESFQGHMANIDRLVKAGKLIVAGPLGKNERNYRGLFIFDKVNAEELEAALQGDPAIVNGLLGYEVYPWYGSAALSEYLPQSDRVWKKKP